jgi:SSS family solute:Na+ symporter
MPPFSLSTLDIVLIFVYLIGVILYGLKHAKQSTSEEYFLAGRDTRWPIVGVSLVAANISSTTMVGLAGAAYSTGISVFNYEWMATVVLVFFAIFFLPFYLKSQVYTMPEFLERRFDARSRYYFSAITLTGNILIDTAGTLYAGGLLIQLIVPGLPMWVICAGLALAAAAYTIPGGLSSVMQTEVLQAVLLLVASIVLSVMTFNQVGSWENVRSVTPDAMLSLVRPADDPTLPWTGLVLGVPLLGFYFWCNNQFMVQRVLSAKNVDHGRWGALFAGLLKLPLLYIMVLPGTMARYLYPDLPKGDLVYPTLLFDLLPVGLIGLVVAGLLAAMASSISATLNSASTLVTMDFVSKLNPQVDSKRLVTIGKLATVVFCVLAVLVAPQISRFQSLFEYLQLFSAILYPPIAAVFVVGLFWKRANGTGAFAGLMVGFAGTLLLSLVKTGLISAPALQQTHFLLYAPLLFGLAAATVVVVSWQTAPPPAAKTEQNIWTSRLYREETRELAGVPWYQNYRTLSVILIGLTALLVGWWW